LHVEVSTAGDDPDSYGKERFDYGQKIERGEIEDFQTLFVCYAAPQDLTDEQISDDPIKWGKLANPAWGHTVGDEEYVADYNESSKSIHEMARFKMYRLNIWQRSANPWLRMDDWAACRGQFTAADLEGEPCGGGLDLSKTEDMTSFSLVFPDLEWEGDETADRPCKLLTWYWLPEGAIDRHRHEVNYAQWARDGWLRVIPGSDVIVYSYVEKDIAQLLEQYDCRVLAFDQKYAAELIQRLAELHGFPEEWQYAFPQTIMGFAGPTAQFERMVIAGDLKHNGNPITDWQAGHVTVKHDANDNIRPVKPEHHDIKKIDGIVSAIMALDAANRMPDYTSAYESGGVVYAGEM